MKCVRLLFLAMMFATLTACGGGDGNEGYGGDSPPPDGGDDTGTPNGGNSGTQTGATEVGSIVISSPHSNAIVDNENGTYRKKFSVSLADQDGTPLSDSTEISLQVVDTILVAGTINGTNPDNASGTSITIPSATDTAGTAVPDLTTTYVVRSGVIGGTHRNILADDLFILTGNVDSRDVVRSIANNPSVSNSLTVSSLLNSSYPAYDNTGYVVAASMLSASVAGEDEEGKLVPGQANPLNKEGVATVWVTYPSDVNHILSGCTPEALDDRVSPAGSSQPMLIATAGDITTIYPFCFSSIAGYQLDATPASVSLLQGNTQTVSVCVEDGGDAVRVPYTRVSAAQTAGTAILGIGYGSTPSLPGPPVAYYTDEYGCFQVAITVTAGASGDSATVTAKAGDGDVAISVSVP